MAMARRTQRFAIDKVRLKPLRFAHHAVSRRLVATVLSCPLSTALSLAFPSLPDPTWTPALYLADLDEAFGALLDLEVATSGGDRARAASSLPAFDPRLPGRRAVVARAPSTSITLVRHPSRDPARRPPQCMRAGEQLVRIPFRSSVCGTRHLYVTVGSKTPFEQAAQYAPVEVAGDPCDTGGRAILSGKAEQVGSSGAGGTDLQHRNAPGGVGEVPSRRLRPVCPEQRR
jgi:hypothetical protein